MTFWEKSGSNVCYVLCIWCLKLGWFSLSQNIYNYAQIHYLKVKPTHFCRYKEIRTDDKHFYYRCNGCGKEIRPS